MLSQDSNSLLNYAQSRLRAEVFSHPVWIRFGEYEASDPLSLVCDLFSAANKVQSDDPSTACQILLLCAVYQNHAGQYADALKTVHQAISLAKAADLPRETIWAMWGACAISFQQGNCEQTIRHLLDLQAVFSTSNDWILANLIDVLRQSLFEPISVPTRKNWQSPHTQPFGDALAIILEGLQHWGFSQDASETEFEKHLPNQKRHIKTLSTQIQSFFSMQYWKGRWRMLMLAFRGELKLQWMEDEVLSEKGRFVSGKSMLRPWSLYPETMQDDAQTIIAPEIPNLSLLPPVQEIDMHLDPAPDKNVSPVVVDAVRERPSEPTASAVSISIQMLGTFNMTIGDSPVKLPSSRAASILKYLSLHHKQNTPREVLMDIFWPDAEPELARNNLNVSIHSLRRALRAATHIPIIMFEDGCYGFAPGIQIWMDIEQFEKCVSAGQRLEARNQRTAATAEYEAAVSLYQGDFLEQNLYEEWAVLDREQLRIAYLDTLDRLSQIYFKEERYSACRSACQLILARDPCREDAHCLLMRCYSRQRQHHLALYQYQICVEALRGELQVEPAPETTQLYNRIRRREQV